ncbi:MAG: cysteine--tRNA ligase [Candidatus Aenigmatarchaeota archaeon]
MKLYNTLTRKKEEFKPIKKGHAGMYCCGPTVYWFAHLGNMRTYIFEDILKRVLLYNGYNVKHVMNYTDVGHLTSDAEEGEDKMIKALRREGKPLTPEAVLEIAAVYEKAFERDAELLNIIRPDIVCKATQHIPEMIELIKRLEKNGFVYRTKVGMIYDVSKFKDYAMLGKLSLEQLKRGARLEPDPERRNPSDFALWIMNQPKQIMQWDSPWGRGFPGWHIECSAMSMKYLGETFDIHCGGIDHIQVHHTNEIAQSEGATGKRFVNYWMHGAFLVMGETEKMAKSEGNIITVQTLIDKGIDPLAFRYFTLTSHYRSELAFSFDALRAAETALKRLYDFMDKLTAIEAAGGGREAKDIVIKAKESFKERISDDLDMPQALAAMQEMINRTNKLIEDRKLSKKGAESVYAAMLDFDKVLGLELGKKKSVPVEIVMLAQKREEARLKKDWKTADEIRNEIKKKGWLIEDSPAGPRLKKA